MLPTYKHLSINFTRLEHQHYLKHSLYLIVTVYNLEEQLNSYTKKGVKWNSPRTSIIEITVGCSNSTSSNVPKTSENAPIIHFVK